MSAAGEAKAAEKRAEELREEIAKYDHAYYVLDDQLIGDDAYDKLLDFSTALTGTTFFVPTAAMLEELAEPPAEPTRAAASSDTSLGIGSLRKN